MKIIIVQSFLPQYRTLFFSELAKNLKKNNYEFKLLFGKNIGTMKSYYTYAEKKRSYRFDFKLGELSTSLVFMPSLYFALKKYAPDVVIAEDLSGLLNSLIISYYCRINKKPYLIWGLGNVPGKKRSMLRNLFALPISWLYRGTSAFICYSEHAKKVYEKYKKPCYVAHNSCLKSHSKKEISNIRNMIKSRFPYKQLQIVYMGSLSKQKRIEILFRTLASIKSTPYRLYIIGGGEEKNKLETLANNLGISKDIRFCGPIYDRDKKKEILMRSHLGILPGRGGLAIQEMMWYGLPVISGLADGTELDLIKNEKNGYLINSIPSKTNLEKQLLKFTGLKNEEKKEMSHRAVSQIYYFINIDNMVRSFIEAVQYTLKPEALLS